MATLNVSETQKKRVIQAVTQISSKLGTNLSQATVVDMGIALLEEKYGINTKRIDNVLN